MEREEHDPSRLRDEIDREFATPEVSPPRAATDPSLPPSRLAIFWSRGVELCGGELFFILLLFGTACYAIPTLFYGLLRLKGTIDPALWGSNHGPWRSSWPGYFILWPLYGLGFLIPTTLCLGLVIALARKCLADAVHTFALFGLFILYFIVLFLMTGWTID